MLNLHLQIHPVFIPMTSRAIIWDFRLRICGIAQLAEKIIIFQISSTKLIFGAWNFHDFG
jgi:hypothetical protein